jgi:hypothetical protein
MPFYDRRTMEGVYSVEQTAQMIRHYRYAEEQMMRIMAGWTALTPELTVKLEFGRQVWDCAQHADMLGKRLPELRSRAQVSEPPRVGQAILGRVPLPPLRTVLAPFSAHGSPCYLRISDAVELAQGTDNIRYPLRLFSGW